MNRDQKKCLIASAALHGTLLLCVLIGSAFIAPEPRVETHTIELVEIPDILVDQEVAGGGNPAAATPPPPPRESTPPPRLRAPEPGPIPEPEPEPMRPQPEPRQIPRPDPVPAPVIKPKPKPKPPQVKVNTTAVRLTPKVNPTPAQPRETAPAFDPSKVADQLTSRIASKVSSSSTTVQIPGPGGPAYASYAAYLREIYRRSWIPPGTGSPNDVVQVEIIVSRSGSVLSAEIIKKSGNVSLDQSVQRTLDRVKVLRPLPDGTTDDKRTFRINFNLDF